MQTTDAHTDTPAQGERGDESVDYTLHWLKMGLLNHVCGCEGLPHKSWCRLTKAIANYETYAKQQDAELATLRARLEAAEGALRRIVEKNEGFHRDDEGDYYGCNRCLEFQEIAEAVLRPQEKSDQ